MPGLDRTQLPYWEARARHWRFAPPLSPSEEDIAWYEANARSAAGLVNGGDMRALMLGVTPAIATMRWPENTALIAVDWAEGMLRSVWPAHGTPPDAAPLRADWRQLPLAEASVDFVVGDNCCSALGSFDDVARLNCEVRRVLRPHGFYCQRCFCGPGEPMSIDELFDALFAGRLRHLDFFRFQLALAVRGASRNGVALQQIWQVWNERVPDPARLLARYSWAELGLSNFKTWRDSAGRYNFLSQAELGELAEPYFDVLATDKPRYELGENFVRVLMRPRAS
jgi:SAM-dependent methyltransferase